MDADKIESLSRGKPPFHEPGFGELLAETLASGRLRFTADFADARGAQVHFVCVGTPQKRGEYAADLRYVESATESLLDVLSAGDLVVGVLLYFGLPHTMKSPPEKTGGYFAVVLVINIVLAFVAAMIVGGIVAAMLIGAAVVAH